MSRVFQENQYLKLIKNIIKKGAKEVGRNGTTYTQIGGMMRFSLENNKIPLMTTKKLAWSVCLKELLWFIRGDTDNKLLQNENVKIWNGNATREFLDSRGLEHLEENDLGPVYGHQWRFWNAKYGTSDNNYNGKGIDQLQGIIDEIKICKETKENSRRMIMSAWNPEQINEMALPPCHVLSQFHITEGNKLSCSLYQRSGDMGLGVPFNIASYALLTMMLAQVTGLKAGDFVHTFGDAHLYENHLEQAKEQLSRSPRPLPTMHLNPKITRLEDFTEDDFELEGYDPHPHIKAPVAV